MWNTDSLWVEVSFVTLFYLIGNIYFGHFEERTPKWRKLTKYIVTLAIIITLSVFLGRAVAFTILGISIIPIIYVHGFILPKKRINGLTGEPKGRYYDFRGWDRNIWGEQESEMKSRSQEQ